MRPLLIVLVILATVVMGVRTSDAPQEDPGVTLEWGTFEPGDQVPLDAFPSPVATPRPPIPEAEATLAEEDRIVIPRLGAVVPIEDAPVVGSRVQVPDGDVVGWVTSSAAPGARQGVSILAGHRDSHAGAQAGPLWDAEDLVRGDPVRVVKDGVPHHYRVVEITRHPRHRLPGRMWRTAGPHMLALTVCTGPYELGHDGQWWLSRNAVIWAEPMPAAGRRARA